MPAEVMYTQPVQDFGPAPEADRSGPGILLLVDDRPDYTAALSSMLTASGLNAPLTASSTAVALDLLRESLLPGSQAIDVLIVPVTGQSAHALEICQALRDEPVWRNIPALALASVTQWNSEMASAYLSAGVEVLFEPLESANLIARVSAAIRLKTERDTHSLREQKLAEDLAQQRILTARLQHQLDHDDLTGLYNRRLFEEAMQDTLERLAITSNMAALIYMDLDQFKLVNELEGHEVGDQILGCVADRLRTQIGVDGIIARVSADEYAVLLTDTTVEAATRLARSVQHATGRVAYEVDGRQYRMGTRVGVAMADSRVNSCEWLTRAQHACYIARTRPANSRVYFYNGGDAEICELRRTSSWAPRIRNALASDEFTLLFQPVVSTQSGKVAHYEALVRMIGEDKGLIRPRDFIPLAENMNLILEIDLWVISKAIRLLQTADPSICININLSGRSFQEPSLVHFVREHLTIAGIAPSRITFEITETAAVAHVERTVSTATQLRDLGCEIALDDFGAGFSSFNYLKWLPVDYLKIDGNFIRGLTKNPVDQTLVKAIIHIARELGKRTIAEYVENGETLALLNNLGVDYVQGHYVGRPRSNLLRKT